jgi:hypothetical protein
LELEKRGARVLVVEAYRTVPARHARRPEELHPDWVLFSSSSTVENFVSLFGAERLQRGASGLDRPDHHGDGAEAGDRGGGGGVAADDGGRWRHFWGLEGSRQGAARPM